MGAGGPPTPLWACSVWRQYVLGLVPWRREAPWALSRRHTGACVGAGPHVLWAAWLHPGEGQGEAGLSAASPVTRKAGVVLVSRRAPRTGPSPRGEPFLEAAWAQRLSLALQPRTRRSPCPPCGTSRPTCPREKAPWRAPAPPGSPRPPAPRPPPPRPAPRTAPPGSDWTPAAVRGSPGQGGREGGERGRPG